ncbi:YwaF family protein [Humisphaera borealis]|uniref:TIGR02206 family membrane protein n=1 Tax=Humisphaera borealis TaxID=2807512 RepID=A0A7M2X199_9BACT|nr:TIGR02206 family membrane protein [Humisphaera borealis]QOV91455.1 TIGR02206 family membrane protein [Humisphaera borealis]
MAVAADIFTTFTPFGGVHLLVVAIILALSAWAVRHRASLTAEPARLKFDKTLVVAGFLLVVANQATELVPWRFELNRSLPIHICDLVGLAAPLAILTHHRVWRAMLFYWGIGLSTQALITPELQVGLGGFTFWVFWIPHGMIIMLAIYDLLVFRYRPTWRDYGIALITLMIYVAVVLPIDLWLDVNYGFVGKGTPGQVSVIDFLGPWPQRLVKLCVGVIVFLATLTLPFVLARRLRQARPEGLIAEASPP